MTNDSPEIELKLQLCDVLADVLHMYREEGPATAGVALKFVIDQYPLIYQDARLLVLILAIEAFFVDSTGKDILEIADLLGQAEISIAGPEMAA